MMRRLVSITLMVLLAACAEQPDSDRIQIKIHGASQFGSYGKFLAVLERVTSEARVDAIEAYYQEPTLRLARLELLTKSAQYTNHVSTTAQEARQAGEANLAQAQGLLAALEFDVSKYAPVDEDAGERENAIPDLRNAWDVLTDRAFEDNEPLRKEAESRIKDLDELFEQLANARLHHTIMVEDVTNREAKVAVDAKKHVDNLTSDEREKLARLETQIDSIARRTENRLTVLDIKAEKGGGSLDNVRDLKYGEIDFALVQSDILYKHARESENGKRRAGISYGENLRAVLPLFPAHIQLLTRTEGGLNSVSDLLFKQKSRPKIGVGDAGSSSSDHANDVLRAYSLIPDVHYEPVNGKGGKQLLADEPELSAVFTSSTFQIPPEPAEQQPAAGGVKFKHLAFQREIIEKLQQDSSGYYINVDAPNGFDKQFPDGMLSVTVFLVTRNDVEPGRAQADRQITHDQVVRVLTEALTSNWPLLRANVARIDGELIDLVGLREALRREPAPYHEAAQEVFVAESLTYKPTEVGVVILICAGLTLALWWIRRLSFKLAGYNRLGAFRDSRFKFLRAVPSSYSGFFWTVLIAILLVVSLTLLVEWMTDLETEYAIANNEPNRFGGFTLTDMLVWIFTFMVSGFANEFPASFGGRVIASFLALGGLLLPLFLTYRGVGIWMQYRQRDARGEGHQREEGHVVVCGWNSKGPGLIYSLTSKHTETKRKIVLVANPEEEEPIRKWEFDSRYVKFVRGETSEAAVLQRAAIADAADVVILASNDKLTNRNLGSALTAIAVRNLNPGANIVVELAFRGNEDYFVSSRVNAIVDAEKISEQVFALSCANDDLCDYFLDALSFDKESELYTLRINELPWWQNSGGSHRELIEVGLQHQVNVLATANRNSSPIETAEKPDELTFTSLTSEQHLAASVAAEEFLICAAQDKRSVKGHRRLTSQSFEHSASNDNIIDGTRWPDAVLIVGLEHRIERVKTAINSYSENTEVALVPTRYLDEAGAAISPELVEKLKEREWDHILVLGHAMGAEVLDPDVAFRLDAEIILKSRLIRRHSNAKIIAEMNMVENRSLFMEAEVTSVIPSSLLAQRFMVRQVSGHLVPQMLMALTAPNATEQLRTITLGEEHPLLNKPMSEVFATRYADGRVIAAVPASKKEALLNQEGDFGTHFMMCPEKEDPLLEAGDRVVALTTS